MDRSRLRNELVADEGYRLAAYKDSVGLWTIGVGHLLGTEPRMTHITASEADALLDLDVDTAIIVVGTLLGPEKFPTFADVRQRALVNMAFNLGHRLSSFTKFLDAVGRGAWTEAGSEMANSKWATQVGARAVRLRRMIETGVEA